MTAIDLERRSRRIVEAMLEYGLATNREIVEDLVDLDIKYEKLKSQFEDAQKALNNLARILK